MKYKLFILSAIIITMVITNVKSDLEIGFGNNAPFVNITRPPITTNYTLVNVNRSDFWGNYFYGDYDLSLSIYWFNQTLATYTAYNDLWSKLYNDAAINQTINNFNAAIINNASIVNESSNAYTDRVLIGNISELSFYNDAAINATIQEVNTTLNDKINAVNLSMPLNQTAPNNFTFADDNGCFIFPIGYTCWNSTAVFTQVTGGGELIITK